jgi:hypothetical protein
MNEKRNDFKAVRELYGKSEKPVVLDIVATETPDDIAGENSFGVSAEAQIIFPFKDYILFGGKIHSGGLWGLTDPDDIEEEKENQIEELKDLLYKLNVNYSEANIIK